MKETKEELLIRRVFKEIQNEYFNNHKLSPSYGNIRFSRGVGEAVANYIQAKQPEYYHKCRRENERI